MSLSYTAPESLSARSASNKPLFRCSPSPVLKPSPRIDLSTEWARSKRDVRGFSWVNFAPPPVTLHYPVGVRERAERSRGVPLQPQRRRQPTVHAHAAVPRVEGQRRLRRRARGLGRLLRWVS
jgi:hypothetical protein